MKRYSRIRYPLKHSRRLQLKNIIAENENGIDMRELKKQTNFAKSVLEHHLRVLEAYEEIESFDKGRHRIYITKENYSAYKNGKNIADNSQAECSGNENSGAKRSGIEDCLEC